MKLILPLVAAIICFPFSCYGDDGWLEKYKNPVQADIFEDCTHSFASGDLRLDSAFFKSYKRYDWQPYNAPAVGVLGKDYKRIDLYFYPNFESMDSLTFAVTGRSKVKNNICDFSGTITITKVSHFWERDYDSPDWYTIVGEYRFEENPKQKGSGVFEGDWAAYAYCDNGILYIDDENAVADGYENRTFVGIWKNYDIGYMPKLCIWGDGKLPLTGDFDLGSGELQVNEKYNSPEWESYISGDEIHYPVNTNEKAYYKNPWW